MQDVLNFNLIKFYFLLNIKVCHYTVFITIVLWFQIFYGCGIFNKNIMKKTDIAGNLRFEVVYNSHFYNYSRYKSVVVAFRKVVVCLYLEYYEKWNCW